MKLYTEGNYYSEQRFGPIRHNRRYWSLYMGGKRLKSSSFQLSITSSFKYLFTRYIIRNDARVPQYSCLFARFQR